MQNMTQSVKDAVIAGNAVEVKEKILFAIENHVPVRELLNEGLIAAMKEVGNLFEEGEYFVPEMLISARAMKTGMSILQPILVTQDIKPLGKVVIGTVKGDLHDIGKNLVIMMLEGVGFQIIDLGTDVSPEKFLEAIHNHQPNILGLSALLTTTMTNMRATIKFLEKEGVRQQVKIIVGGAPITQKYAVEIGADGFASDANQAAQLAKMLLEKG